MKPIESVCTCFRGRSRPEAPTLSGPVSAWSFPKYGKCFGKWDHSKSATKQHKNQIALHHILHNLILGWVYGTHFAMKLMTIRPNFLIPDCCACLLYYQCFVCCTSVGEQGKLPLYLARTSCYPGTLSASSPCY